MTIIYRSTVILNITTVSLVYVDSIPEAYRLIMGFPCIVIMNIMASRIYRNVNSGVFRLGQGENGTSAIANINLSGHGMDEIIFNQTGIGSVVSREQWSSRYRKKLGQSISLSESTECDCML